MTAYYNEIDPFAAQWLRNLIAAGHIAPGDVDERDIRDVAPADLGKYTQCHFFAGIGVWSLALRTAGWPDDREVWTASCPCQPFSAAGSGDGFADERHLWPFAHYLIEEQEPLVLFGEQVASADGLHWLDLVQADMEGTGYAFGAQDICAAGVGAPHIRQRLYFVADTPSERYEGAAIRSEPAERGQSSNSGDVSGLVFPNSSRRPARKLAAAGMGYGGTVESTSGTCNKHGGGYPTSGFWSDAEWIFCTDNKWRAVEPGTFPLAHGAAARVGRLRAYGNAIVAEVAATYIKAYLTHSEALV